MRTTYHGPPADLANVLDQADGLTAHCERRSCGHFAPLDVAALAAKFGRDFEVPALRSRLTCAKCGGREVAVTRTPGRTKEYRP